MVEVEVKVKVPSDLVGLLKPRRVEDEVKLLVALELYREGKVSLGKAAGIAGLSIREFLNELRTRGVSINYDLEELEKDFRTIRELLVSKEDQFSKCRS